MTVSHKSLLDGTLNVSRETFTRLESFESLFLQWANRINLVAGSTKADIWSRHIEDSAQLLMIKPDMRHIVDIGSGGGFPGAVLAVLLNEYHDAQVHLVESNRKKTAFLQAVRSHFAPCCTIHAKRVEDALPGLEVPQYVTARALANLPGLFGMTESFLASGSTGLFHKGREFERELEESRANWDFDLIIHKSQIDRESVILEISNLKRKAEQT